MGKKKFYFMGPGGSTTGIDPDKDTNVTVEGVAKSGKISKHGIVAHNEHWDGRMDANVQPGPVSLKSKQPKE